MYPRRVGSLLAGVRRQSDARHRSDFRCYLPLVLDCQAATGPPQDFTSWEAIYRTLVAAFPSDRYHRGATLTDFGNRDGVVRLGAGCRV